MIRTYSEMIRLPTLEERYHYLSLQGSVGQATFGFDRWLNQGFYTSREWKQLRQHVIARDNGCDLADPNFVIYDRILVHHMNPITPDDIAHGEEAILDPEFLITTQHRTHNAIHYGDESLLPTLWIERKPGDTKSW